MESAMSISPLQVAALAQISWLCIDIETGDASEDDITAAIAAWKPPGNVKKPETIEKYRAAAPAQIRDHAALLDASPILCIGAQTDTGSNLFTSFGKIDVSDCTIIDATTEKDMLIIFRAWLNGLTEEDTLILGHNVRGFDLPKIRHAYIRHRLRLPYILQPDNRVEIFDTMDRVKSFSMTLRGNPTPSLDLVCLSLGIDRPKQVISGDEVPRLAREGQYQAIGTYCAIDCAATARAFLLMSSAAMDMA